MSKFANLFTKQSSLYARFRPDYPSELFDILFQRLSPKQPLSLAVDVATGTGQVARALAKTFHRVVGADISEEQLRHADPIENVTYIKSKAEQLDVIDSDTVDLVTVGQALHWFDLNMFYPEVSRVLKKDGTLAVWGYSLNRFDNDQANKLMMEFYDGTLKDYWSERRGLVDSGLSGMTPKGNNWRDITPISTQMCKKMTLDNYLGYLRSWSAVVTYLEKNPGADCPVEEFGEQLSAILNVNSSGEIEICWDIFGFTARSNT